MLNTIGNKLVLAVLILIFFLQICSSFVQVYQVQSKLIDDLESDARNITTPFLLEIETKIKQLTRDTNQERDFSLHSFTETDSDFRSFKAGNSIEELVEIFALVYGSRAFPPLLQEQESLHTIQFINHEGKILYHPDKNLVKKTIDPLLKPSIKKQTLTSSEFDSLIHITVPFFFDHTFMGSLVLSYSMQRLNKEKRDVLQTALFLLIIYLLIGGIGAWGISRGITKPIHQLCQVFKIVASGNFDQKIDTSREDELGVLAQSFAYLQDAIKEKIQFIENYNRTLEQTVLERTEDILQQKDDELQAMYRNIKQGIFSVGANNIIEEQYSVYLQTLLETNDIAGTNVLDTVFSNCDLDTQTLHYLNLGLAAIITKDMQAYGSNRHLLVNEIEKQQIDGSTRILEIDWHPILNTDAIVEKMMITLRDVTNIRQLKREVTAWKNESRQIRKSLESTKGKFETYGNPEEHLSPDIITLTMLMPKILYICSWDRGKASEIFLEDSEMSIKSLLSLQKIEETLVGKVLRPHFSYLVNPNKEWRITRRSSSDYNLEYQDHKVPISRSNVRMIKNTFEKASCKDGG